MFARAIQNAKDDLAGIMHGTSANAITGIIALLERAMRTTLTRIDPPETHRRHTLTIQKDVTLYNAPEDLKDRKITDFGPTSDRTSADSPRNIIGNDFDKYRRSNTIRIVTLDGETKLRIIKPVTSNTEFFLDYYSSYGFRSADDDWSDSIEEAGGDSAILNLGVTSYDIWLYEAAILAAQQNQGQDSANDILLWRQILYGHGATPGLYAEYLEGQPSEAIAPRSTWY